MVRRKILKGHKRPPDLKRQMLELGKELRMAKQTMKTVGIIPPAPFFHSRRGVGSRFDENMDPKTPAPRIRTGSYGDSKIGSLEKRVMKVHDDMAKMKELIDRIQNNMSDL